MTNREAIAGISEFITDAERQIRFFRDRKEEGINLAGADEHVSSLKKQLKLANKQILRFEKLVEVGQGDEQVPPPTVRVL